MGKQFLGRLPIKVSAAQTNQAPTARRRTAIKVAGCRCAMAFILGEERRPGNRKIQWSKQAA